MFTYRSFFVCITSMHSRQVYLLSPKELSPETIAVAFAKISRSPESFRQITAVEPPSFTKFRLLILR